MGNPFCGILNLESGCCVEDENCRSDRFVRHRSESPHGVADGQGFGKRTLCFVDSNTCHMRPVPASQLMLSAKRQREPSKNIQCNVPVSFMCKCRKISLS